MAGEKLYITEYANAPQAQLGQVLACGAEPGVAVQVIDFSAGAAASAAFNAKTTFVRIHTNAICSLRFSTAGTAATTSYPRMAANATEFYGVQPADKVSVIINT